MTDNKNDGKKTTGKHLASTTNNKGVNVNLSGNTFNFISIDGKIIEFTTETGMFLFKRLAGGAKKATEELRNFANNRIHDEKKNNKIQHEIAEKDMEHAIVNPEMQNRFLNEQEMYQRNLENVGAEAANNLNGYAEPEKIPEDWFQKFSHEARMIGDENVRKYWGRLLAENANNNGSFSKNAISVLASMDGQDAEDFTKLCSFVFNCSGKNQLFINNPNEYVYEQNGLNFEMLFRFCELGLLMHSSSIFSTAYAGNDKNLALNCSYFNERIIVHLNLASPKIDRGSYSLTRTGQELSKICKPKKIDGFFGHVLAKFREQGHEVEMPSVSIGEFVIIDPNFADSQN